MAKENKNIGDSIEDSKGFRLGLQLCNVLKDFLRKEGGMNADELIHAINCFSKVAIDGVTEQVVQRIKNHSQGEAQ